MNVFVSIIMPTYNRGYLIQNAVNSVLEQTHSKWELIIVDDGSKDNTKEIIQKNADHRIRYIRYDNNQGANHARNVGLKEAKGDYICFLDSDSMLYENCLQKRISFINKTDSDFIWGRVNFSHVDGIERIKPSESAEILIDRDQTVKTHMLYGLIDTNSVFMKKELPFSVGYFDENLPRLQDKEYFLRIITDNRFKISFLDDCLVASKLQKNSISLNSKHLWEAYAYILKKHIDIYRERDILGEAFTSLLQLDEEREDVALSVLNVLSTDERELFFKKSIELISRLKNKCRKSEWRFPREKVQPSSRVIIYGAGKVGEIFVRYLNETHYCDVVLWVDKNYNKYDVSVQAPQRIKETVYDYVVIAIADDSISDDVMVYLNEIGVNLDKIVRL